MRTTWNDNHEFLLWRGGLHPLLWNKRRPAGPFRLEQDCVAIETPSNLTHYIGLEAMCLIWRWKITGEGYGLISLPNKRVKVHRLTYALSREVSIEEIADGILHVCHRPYCVQPGHLYEGTPAQNNLDTADRKRMVPQGGWPKITELWNLGCHTAQYLWTAPDPPALPTGTQAPPPSLAPVHRHVGEAPADDAAICNTCGIGTPTAFESQCVIQFGDRGHTLHVPGFEVARTGWAADNCRVWWNYWFPDQLIDAT